MTKRKLLVVYYSRTGTTRRLGRELAKALGADTDEIVEASGRDGFSGYWRSVSEARRRLPAATAAGGRDPSAYDLVIVGTPVWAWSVSSPVRAYLAVNRARIRDVAFFATMGGTGANSAFAQMEALVGKASRAALAVTAREIVKGGYDEDLKAFVAAVHGAKPAGRPARKLKSAA